MGVLRGFVEVSRPSLFFRSEGLRIRGLEQTSVVHGAIQPVTRVNADEWGLMKESYELLEKTAVMEAERISHSVELPGPAERNPVEFVVRQILWS